MKSQQQHLLKDDADKSLFNRFREHADCHSQQRCQHHTQEERPFLPDFSFLSDPFRNNQGKYIPNGEYDADPDDVHSCGVLIKEDQKKYQWNNDSQGRHPGATARNAFCAPYQEKTCDGKYDKGPGENI